MTFVTTVHKTLHLLNILDTLPDWIHMLHFDINIAPTQTCKYKGSLPFDNTLPHTQNSSQLWPGKGGRASISCLDQLRTPVHRAQPIIHGYIRTTAQYSVFHNTEQPQWYGLGGIIHKMYTKTQSQPLSSRAGCSLCSEPIIITLTAHSNTYNVLFHNIKTTAA